MRTAFRRKPHDDPCPFEVRNLGVRALVCSHIRAVPSDGRREQLRIVSVPVDDQGNAREPQVKTG